MLSNIDNPKRFLELSLGELNNLTHNEWDKSYLSFRLSKLYSDLTYFKTVNADTVEVVDSIIKCIGEIAAYKLLEDKTAYLNYEEAEQKVHLFFQQ